MISRARSKHIKSIQPSALISMASAQKHNYFMLIIKNVIKKLYKANWHML